MSMRNVSDLDVCRAYLAAGKKRKDGDRSASPLSELLETKTEELKEAQRIQAIKEPWKPREEPEISCQKAIERACNRGLLTYNNRRQFGWLTEAGQEFLRSAGESVEVDRSESESVTQDAE